MKQRFEKEIKIGNYFIIAALAIGLPLAWHSPNTVPKAYTVTLSLDEWRSALGTLDTCSKLLNKSDLPARDVIFANSGLASINQAIQFQVSQQLQAEAKKDSTNAVKPKIK